jgi:uncharacterized repeat protein (TIGR02543 family)
MMKRRVMALAMSLMLSVSSFNMGAVNSFAADPGTNESVVMPDDGQDQSGLEAAQDGDPESENNETEEAAASEEVAEEEAGKDANDADSALAVGSESADTSGAEEEGADAENEDSAAAEGQNSAETAEDEVEELSDDDPSLQTSYKGLTLDANGGHFEDGSEIVELFNAKNSKIAAVYNYKPVRDGKTFTGWYLDKDCTEDKCVSSSVNLYLLKENWSPWGIKSDYVASTLYAGWSDYQTVNVYFDTDENDSNGGGVFYNDAYYEPVRKLTYEVPVGKTISSLRIDQNDKYISGPLNDHIVPHDDRNSFCGYYLTPEEALSAEGQAPYDYDSIGKHIDGMIISEEFPGQDVINLYAGYEMKNILVTFHLKDGYSKRDSDRINSSEGQFKTYTQRIYALSDGCYYIYSPDERYDYYPYQPLQYQMFLHEDASKRVEGFYFDENLTAESRLTFNGKEKENLVTLAGERIKDSRVDIYVKWTDNTEDLIVTYDLNGGAYAYDTDYEHLFTDPYKLVVRAEDNRYVDDSQNVLIWPVYPNDRHKAFKGWYYDKECKKLAITSKDNKDYTGDFTVDQNYIKDDKVTLYAGWENRYHVATFKLGSKAEYVLGHSTYDYTLVDSRTIKASFKKENSDSIWELSPVRYVEEGEDIKTGDKHVQFNTWYVNGKELRHGREYNSDISLDAAYTNVVFLTYHFGDERLYDFYGFTDNTWVDAVTKGVETVLRGGSGTGEFEADEHARYVECWCSDQGLTKPVPFTITPTKDMDLYAKWVSYSGIKFDLNGGTYYGNPSIELFGLKAGESLENRSDVYSRSMLEFTPEKTGFIFGGWYEDPECTDPITIDEMYTKKITGTFTVYAGWWKDGYIKKGTLRITDQYGEAITDIINVDQGEAVQLRAFATTTDGKDIEVSDPVLQWGALHFAEYDAPKEKQESTVHVSVGNDGLAVARTKGYSKVRVRLFKNDDYISDAVWFCVSDRTFEKKLTVKVVGKEPDEDGIYHVSNKEVLHLEAEISPASYASDIVWYTGHDDFKIVADTDRTKATLTPGKQEVMIRIAAYSMLANLRGEILLDFSTPATAPTADAPESDPKVTDGETIEVVRGQRVRLLSKTPGASVYYIVNGEAATGDAATDVLIDGKKTYRYTDAITVNAEISITAISVKEGFENSSTVTYTYKPLEDWGDAAEYKDNAVFGGDISKVPEGVWYVIGDEVLLTSDVDTGCKKTYTGGKITFNPDVKVFAGTERLIENRDYTLSYTGNVNSAGPDAKDKNGRSIAPTVTVTGKGNFTSSAAFRFTIEPEDMDKAEITSDLIVPVAIGPSVKLGNIRPVVSYGGKKLVAGKDYELKYYHVADSETLEPVENPAATVLDKSGTLFTYVIKIEGIEGGNFTGVKDADVTVRTIDGKDKSIVKISGLKIGNIKGKAVTAEYDPDRAPYTAEDLFDNSDGKTPMAYVYRRSAATDPLIYGQDFIATLTDDDNKSAGKHGFVIVGVGATHIGSKNGTYTITEKPGQTWKQVKIAGLLTTAEYTGEEITLKDLFNAKDKVAAANKWDKVTLYRNVKEGGVTKNVVLEEGTDYEVLCSNTGAVGKFDIVFKGIGGYSGSIKKTITVKAYNMNDAKKSQPRIRVECDYTALYKKTGAVPEDINVSFVVSPATDTEPEKVITLREGTDYTISFRNNRKPVEDYGSLKESARPTVIVKGKGSFTGSSAGCYFSISRCPIADVEMAVSDVYYNPDGKAGYFFAKPSFTDGTGTLTVGKGKDIEYYSDTRVKYYYATGNTVSEGEDAGKAEWKTLKANDKIAAGTQIKAVAKVFTSGKGNYEGEGTITGYYTLIDKKYDIKNARVTSADGGQISFEYNNGTAIIPLKKQDLKVTLGGSVLSSEDYEIESIKGNTFLGTATVVIRGKGVYGGTKSFTFKITARQL